MAIAWFVGVDSQNAGCVKIMASDMYDPYLTPDSDFAKFLFNSKWDANVRFVGVDQLNFANGEFTSFFPSGTNKNNFLRVNIGYDLGNTEFFWKKEFFQTLGQLDYDLPVFDVKIVNNSGVYTYGIIRKNENNNGTLFYSNGGLEDGFCHNYSYGGGGALADVTMANVLFSYGVSGQNRRVSVWNLPADETDILDPALTPVAGQTQVEITKDFCRVSKPGYAVEVATPSQLAFDSSTRPAKVIASGDIALPAGTTVFDFSANLSGITVSGQLVADVIQYKGSTIVFPASVPSDDDEYGASYFFSGNTLVFSNSGSSCRARILIIAQDSSPLTVGDNDVWREFNDGTQDVVQFLRPGADNPPNLADVIIDSRWPCLQIIKTGVFNIPVGNNELTDIPFNSAGLFPFIKYFTIHGAGQPNQSFGPGTASASKRVRLPYTAAGFARNPDSGSIVRWTSGVCTYVELTTNLARFHTFRGNVYRLKYTQNSNNQYVLGNDSVSCPAYAIRYYIFGIPA